MGHLVQGTMSPAAASTSVARVVEHALVGGLVPAGVCASGLRRKKEKSLATPN